MRIPCVDRTQERIGGKRHIFGAMTLRPMQAGALLLGGGQRLFHQVRFPHLGLLHVGQRQIARPELRLRQLARPSGRRSSRIR